MALPCGGGCEGDAKLVEQDDDAKHSVLEALASHRREVRCLTSDPRVVVTTPRARVPRWSLQPDKLWPDHNKL